MSTSSSATGLGRDPVPTNDSTLKARMCVFIIMQKDGTPFNVTSVMEEDILQLCMALGHTHPLGVLWYLATQLVALFHMAEEMQLASCGAIKAMELHDESIAIKTVATRALYKGIHHCRGGDPYTLWSAPSEGRVTLIHLLITLTMMGVLCNASRQSLATSQIRNCGNSWKISTRRLHFASCMHPPAILNQLLGVNLKGAVILMGMTWRSPFQEGEGGFPQDNHLQLQFQHDQVEEGFLRDHLLST